MGKALPLGDVPKTGDVIAGMIEYEIEGLEPTTTGTGKYAINGQFRALEPDDVAGRMVFEMFVIGTQDDPSADDPLTFGKKASMGLKTFRDLLVAAGVQETGDDESTCAAAKGNRFTGKTVVETQAANNKDGSANQYAGNMKSRIKRYFKTGEKALSVDAPPEEPGAANGSGKAPIAAQQQAPPPPPPAVVRPQ